jgi:hypothetical protein
MEPSLPHLHGVASEHRHYTFQRTLDRSLLTLWHRGREMFRISDLLLFKPNSSAKYLAANLIIRFSTEAGLRLGGFWAQRRSSRTHQSQGPLRPSGAVCSSHFSRSQSIHGFLIFLEREKSQYRMPWLLDGFHRFCAWHIPSPGPSRGSVRYVSRDFCIKTKI